MIETVEKIALPVDEKLIIEKNHIASEDGFDKRISVVSGIHGDELDGQYICYELARRINENIQWLHGTVDIYPVLNPLGMDSIQRGFPPTGTDMNSVFPGTTDGILMESVASHIVDDLVGSDLCIDVHSSSVFLQELPQVRVIKDWQDKLLKYAALLNTDLIWVQETDSHLEATFSYAMNCVGVPAFTVEMGVGMYITRKYGDEIVDGILAIMSELGMWDGDRARIKKPQLADINRIELVTNNEPGIFMPDVKIGQRIEKDQQIGEIVSSIEGKVLEKIYAHAAGRLYTIREYPLVYKGSLLARIITDEKGGE